MASNLKVFDLSSFIGEVMPDSPCDGMFWLFADTRPYVQEQDIATLCAAFAGLRPILWSVAMGRGSSEKLQDYHRGFGFKASDLDYIQKMNMIRHDRPKKVYSDVVWLSQVLHPLVAEILSLNSSGISLSLSFIPNSPDMGYRWASASTGLLWLNLLKSERLPSSHRRTEFASSTILEFVRLTTEMGGVALLSASDIDTTPSIFGFGSQVEIQNALKYLATDFELIPQVEGRRLFLHKRPMLNGLF